MPTDIPPAPVAPAPYVPYDLIIGTDTFTVLEPQQPDARRVRTPSGQVIGLACADSSTVLDVAGLTALLATPQIPTPTARTQSTRTILDRLTPTEAAALTACTQPGIQLLVLKATAAGTIREDDPDFPTARAGLDALGIIATTRWTALFAP